MVKKHSDGNYYEKIVNWKRNEKPHYLAVWGAGSILFFLGYFLGIESYEPDILFMLIVCFGIAIFLFIFNFYETHNKKIKFRRIGN